MHHMVEYLFPSQDPCGVLGWTVTSWLRGVQSCAFDTEEGSAAHMQVAIIQSREAPVYVRDTVEANDVNMTVVTNRQTGSLACA